LLRDDPVAGMAGADRLDDQLLGHVVDLGDDVLGRLEVDALDLLEALGQDPPGVLREGDREGGHCVEQSASSGSGELPSLVTTAVKVTLCPGWTRGDWTLWPGEPIRRGVSWIQHVMPPAFVP